MPASESGENTAILRERSRLVGYGLQTVGGILLAVIGFIAKDAYVTAQEIKQDVTALKVRQDADERDKTTLRAEMRDGFAGIDRKLEKIWEKLEKQNGNGGSRP